MGLFIKHLTSTMLLFLLIDMSVYAQKDNSILIKSMVDKKPVDGALVELTLLDKSNTTLKVSDNKGLVEVPFSPPYLIKISHLNFHSKYDTITNESSRTILLEEKSVYLKDVVITGQYEPQSARNSVYKITTVERERIQNQGATNVQDVLSNLLNVRFSRDNATGVANVSLQGISGQNVKVLLDGVPITGRSGVNNEIDLNQINVNDIERIEIVEGPMAVNYGSDALAGVINVITRKDIEEKLQLHASVHEESVRNEYGFFKDGIHTPSLSLGYHLNETWYTQVSTRINRFGGWQGNNQGRDKAWYPKTQYFIDGLLRFEKEDYAIYYKVSYLDELLENLGPISGNNPLRDPVATDEEYKSHRIIHQLQSNWTIAKAKVHTTASFTNYKRNTRQFVKNLVTGDETQTVAKEQDTTFYQSVFTRNTISNLLSRSWLNTQLGIETTFETAGGTMLTDGNKHLTDLAFFASAEFTVKEKLKIRPGLRTAFNSIYTTIPVASVNIKYDISNTYTLRIGYGRGFRAPSIRELYHEFIDSNHNIYGNDDLEPEYSHHVNADFRYKNPVYPFTFSVGGFYNYIDNRIILYNTSGPEQKTTYTNLERFKSLGAVSQLTYNLNNLNISTGLAYTGRYQLLNKSHHGQIPEFVFSPEINTSIQYTWLRPDIRINLFYKYTGVTKNYQLTSDTSTGESSPVLAKTDAYQLLDITAGKDWTKSFSTLFGIKNALDITFLNSTSASGGLHGTNGPVNIAYGRSYFMQFNYKITK